MKDLKSFVVIMILYLVIDLPVIGYLNSKMYVDNFKQITNGKTTFKLIPAMVAYLILSLSVYYFIIKKSSNITTDSLMLGFVIYGIYNATNLATLKNYSVKVSIVDTLWGSFLTFLISNLSKSILNII